MSRPVSRTRWLMLVAPHHSPHPKGAIVMTSAEQTVANLVVDLRDLGDRDASVVGTKAANLARLSALGLRVPEGFVITTAACDRILATAGNAGGARLEGSRWAEWDRVALAPGTGSRSHQHCRKLAVDGALRSGYGNNVSVSTCAGRTTVKWRWSSVATSVSVRRSARAMEVPDLGDHGGRDQEFPVGGVHVSEQANARQVVGIIGQRGGDQRTGVADDHAGRPNPSSSSSSDRAPTSGVLP